jgi:hypothetical protein
VDAYAHRIPGANVSYLDLLGERPDSVGPDLRDTV